jgi:disulfide oxidoreductase YuzD
VASEKDFKVKHGLQVAGNLSIAGNLLDSNWVQSRQKLFPDSDFVIKQVDIAKKDCEAKIQDLEKQISDLVELIRSING